jgi:hypothetical protein
MTIYKDFIKESKQHSMQIEYDFDNICICKDSLIAKLEKNKLKKEDRELLIEAIVNRIGIKLNEFKIV